MRISSLASRFSIGLFLGLVISLCACHKAKAEGAQALAENVAAAIPCFPWDIEKDFADAGSRLDSLSMDESETADRALVMLMGYYLGEHNWEELDTEIVRRGKRMKLLLVQEQQAPAVLSTCASQLELEHVKELANSAIKAIDQEGSK
jgi:hypothetical protein